MDAPFLSDHWYRFAALKPMLKPHLYVVRQRFRGKAWYVIHDSAANRSFRYSPAAWLLTSSLDGQTTLDAIWQRVIEQLGDDAPSQDEVIQIVMQLHASDLLQTDRLPDIGELIRRGERQIRSRWLRNVLNPMSMKFPLWDPDSFLLRWLPLLRPLFSMWGLIGWLALVLPAAFLAAQHWVELTANLSDRLLDIDNLWLLLIVFPIVKLCHELGHAFATRINGGEVHELGVMLLVMAPSPYVDASASAAFRSKWRRAFVGAAGMMVELAIAALVMYVWLALEPGLMRSLAFNVISVAGLSTLVFNGNPLLRYDGYYILCDLIEIPNLAQRASQYYFWLLRFYLFGERSLKVPHATTAESVWFVAYAPLSFAYRVFVAVSIALFVASKYFFVGVILAIWSIAGIVLTPIWKALQYVRTGVANQHSKRKQVVTWVLVFTFILLFGVLPFPASSTTQGVVWVPEKGEVRSAGTGFVSKLQVSPGAQVKTQTPILALHEPNLMAQYQAQWAKVSQLQVESTTYLGNDPVQAALAMDSLKKEQSTLRDLERRLSELVTYSPTAGRYIQAAADDLPGRFVKRGDLLGYVVGPALNTIRVVVPQDDVGQLRQGVKLIKVKIADRLADTFTAKLVREVPSASQRLPSKALTIDGGGPYLVDPSDSQRLTTTSRVFQFDIELMSPLDAARLGTRAYIRFELQPEPLALQFWRRIRQTFLGALHV